MASLVGISYFFPRVGVLVFSLLMGNIVAVFWKTLMITQGAISKARIWCFQLEHQKSLLNWWLEEKVKYKDQEATSIASILDSKIQEVPNGWSTFLTTDEWKCFYSEIEASGLALYKLATEAPEVVPFSWNSVLEPVLVGFGIFLVSFLGSVCGAYCGSIVCPNGSSSSRPQVLDESSPKGGASKTVEEVFGRCSKIENQMNAHILSMDVKVERLTRTTEEFKEELTEYGKSEKESLSFTEFMKYHNHVETELNKLKRWVEYVPMDLDENQKREESLQQSNLFVTESNVMESNMMEQPAYEPNIGQTVDVEKVLEQISDL